MRGYYTPDAVRAAESPLLAALPDGALMRRAAYGLAQVCAAELRSRTGGVVGRRVTLLVGSGDNGGDALHAGAFLCRRGVAVDAVLLAPDRAHAAGLAAFRRAGGKVTTAGPGERSDGEEEENAGERSDGEGNAGERSDGEDAAADRSAGGSVRAPDLVVDGIVGVSGHGPLRPDAARVVAAVRAPIVAADTPSGVDVMTGRIAGPAVRAAVTVAFGAYKPVHALAPSACGRVELIDIGLDLGIPELTSLEDADVRAAWPVPGENDDKYSQGVVGIAAGSATYPGAAVLATGSAIRATSGMVRYAGTAREAVLARWPEVVAVDRPTDAGRVQAWAVGPGFGTDAAAADELRGLLEQDLPAVVDADALTLAAGHPELLAARSAATLLTPHAGEFARLAATYSPDGAAALGSGDRVAAARALARDMGATVLLKGFSTVIAAPDGRVVVDTAGSSWAATPGSGDVLTGVCGALLATGREPLFAGALAARVHAEAAARAAEGAPTSASRISAAIPGVLRRVLADVTRG